MPTIMVRALDREVAARVRDYARVREISTSAAAAQLLTIALDAQGDLLAAARVALKEMCCTVAPRDSFTDAVDALDAAITKAEGRPEPAKDRG